MEKDFSKNQLKPGDPGFEYDKRITFDKNDNDEPLEDDSWGEESDDEVMPKNTGQPADNNTASAAKTEQKYGHYDNEDDEDEDDMDYFDDDFS